MRVFMMAASLREGSFNKKLLLFAASIFKAQGVEVDIADFSEFMLPLYNADIQEQEGFPEQVEAYIARMHAADAHVIASPEYNNSLPGTLKNLIDWVSRKRPMPWKRQNILLLSASPSEVGGNRGLWQLRIPLECCGAYVFPRMVSIADAPEAFDAEDNLKDEGHKKRLESVATEFIDFVQCMRRKV